MNKLSMTMTGLFTVVLTACGGGSGGSSSATGIEIDESLKGPASEPSLTTVTSGSLTINNLAKSFLYEDELDTWSFSTGSSTDVLLVLSSSAEDFDLSVSGNNVNEVSSGFTSDELIFFSAVAGVNYQIDVDAFTGDGNYELVVTTPNRESLGLSSDEYLVDIQSEIEYDCNSGIESFSSSNTDVINWARGYIGQGDDREEYDSVDGSTLTFNFEYSESEPEWDYSYSSTGTMTLTVDPQTGKFTGSFSGTSTETDDGDVDNCTLTETISGQIIL